jgi:hypothetical protein
LREFIRKKCRYTKIDAAEPTPYFETNLSEQPRERRISSTNKCPVSPKSSANIFEKDGNNQAHTNIEEQISTHEKESQKKL